MGTFYLVLWNLFQVDGTEGIKVMGTDTIFIFAIVVYVLMAAGMLVTMREFNRISEDPSTSKSEQAEASE